MEVLELIKEILEMLETFHVQIYIYLHNLHNISKHFHYISFIFIISSALILLNFLHFLEKYYYLQFSYGKKCENHELGSE